MSSEERQTQSERQKARWQMILATGPESALGEVTDEQQAQMEALTFLYDREYGSRNVRPGSQGASAQGGRASSGSSSDGTTESKTDNNTHKPGESGHNDNQQGASNSQEQDETPTANRHGDQESNNNNGEQNGGNENGEQEDGNNNGEQDGGNSNSAADNTAESDGGKPFAAKGGEQLLGSLPGATVGSPNVQGLQDEDALGCNTGLGGGSGNGASDGSGSDGSGDATGQTSGNISDHADADNGLGDDSSASGEGQMPPQNRRGGRGPSRLTVPEWINAIHELFPKKTIERLEKDALERYKLEELVTNADLLSRVEPSQTLLKAVLRTKHLMNPTVLAMARQLVQQVIADLMKELARDIKTPFSGALNRQQRSFLKIAKNFDPETTIRQNLSTYDPDTQKLYIKTPYFFSRIRRQMDRWQLIIVVDESGSMLDSVIHAAVTASIFYQLQNIRTHLCIFDTEVVDLTEQCSDPVETLMQVQLGGGTDIGNALTYAGSLVTNPRNTIIILISDFFEGASVNHLYRVASNLIESGVTLLGLAALDAEATPTYDHAVAQELVNRGAHVGAMTPRELAEWVAKKVRS